MLSITVRQHGDKYSIEYKIDYLTSRLFGIDWDRHRSSFQCRTVVSCTFRQQAVEMKTTEAN